MQTVTRKTAMAIVISGKKKNRLANKNCQRQRRKFFNDKSIDPSRKYNS